MKKLSLLAIAVCALVTMGCSHSAENENKNKNENEITVNNKGNFMVKGVEIPYSSFESIPAGSVTGGDSNKINNYSDPIFGVKDRNLTIPAFKMGRYEVTQRLYKAVMSGDSEVEAEPSFCKGASNTVSNETYVYSDTKANEKDLRPVEGVTWYDAVYFCNKLSEKTGKNKYYTITDITRYETIKAIKSATVTVNEGANGYRLPTNVEWEYAARGGNPSGSEWGYFFAGKASTNTESPNEDLDSVGWYYGNSVNGTTAGGGASSGNTGYGTHRVGLKAPVSGTIKLYDMTGNVMEWCWDRHADSITADTPASGPETGTHRDFRGGDWKTAAYNCTVLHRESVDPAAYNCNRGFRVVCSVDN